MDAIQLVIDALEASVAVTTLVSVRIYGGALPEHTDPTGSPAIVVHVRGGSAHAEMPVSTPSVGVTCWAGINQFKLARSVYTAVFEALHGLANEDFGPDGRIIYCVEEVTGQDVTDPEAGWATVVSYYTMMISGSDSDSAVVDGGTQ